MIDPGTVLGLLWLAWIVSWFIAARWASPPTQIASGNLVLFYRVSLVVGMLLIAVPGQQGWTQRLWHLNYRQGWAIDLLALAGFAFCWWARVHLGRLWSGNVTIKPEHRIVDSGPYGWVRHPIYTGLLVAILASVAISGTLRGVIGGLIMLAGIIAKARLEEQTLREALGRDAYDAYAERVPMLIPFLR